MSTPNLRDWKERLNEKDYWMLDDPVRKGESGCPIFTRVNRQLVDFLESEIELAEKRGFDEGHKQAREDCHPAISLLE